MRVGICHCQDCRQASGSAFTFFGIWPRAAVEMRGTIAQYSGRGFCPTCGSRIVSVGEGEAEVMLGSLDNGPGDLTPQYELWVPRREHWLTPVEGSKQFKGDRDADIGNTAKSSAEGE